MKTQLLSILFITSSSTLFSQISTPPNGDNQKSRVSQWIGPVEVTITYNSPDVHGPDGADRTGHIWGELVPYGFVDQGFGTAKSAPWRAGANQNTTIYVSHDVKVEGKELKAGTYGFFIAPEKEGKWTVIFSKDSESWGSYFYDAGKDALRVQVDPTDATYTEWLTYGFDNRMPNSTIAYLQWENKKVPFKIEVPNVNEIQLGIIENELKNYQGFDYKNWKDAALFCVNNNLSLDKALYFADNAISMPFVGQENFTTLEVKAEVLTAMKRTDEANKTMEKAIHHPSATVQDIHAYARKLIKEGKTQEALDIYKYNRKQHPEDTFTTYVGLARGYAAVGDKKNAIKNWEIAIKNLPEDQKPYLSYYQGELDKLKG
jgi:hypothetical protein